MHSPGFVGGDRGGQAAPRALPARALLGLALVLVGVAIGYLAGSFARRQEAPVADGRPPAPQAEAPTASARPMPGSVGYSGMAALDDRTYVVVHDTKSADPAGRVGVVTAARDGSLAYEPVAMDWRAFGASSDLESVCALPATPSEFLLVESGRYRDRIGRMYRARIARTASGWSGTVVAAGDMPGDLADIEGVACLDANGGVLLLLAERGDLPRKPGRLLWGGLDLANVAFVKRGEAIVPSSGTSRAPPYNRVATDLWVHRGELWASATKDSDVPGQAFGSAVFVIGWVDPGARDPVRMRPAPELKFRVDGFKVEALGPAPGGHDGASIGSDDEATGGAWRPLEPPPGG